MVVVLLDVLLAVHRQPRLAGVLSTLATAGPRLGVPCYVACVLRDPGTDAWHLTALLDPAGRPASLERLGVSDGPFAFMARDPGPPRPLAEFMGLAWGPEACARVERMLGTVAAVSSPIAGARGPRGALLALLPTWERAELPATLLLHGGDAAARLLDQEAAIAIADGVLDSRTMAETANGEIARAERYRRQLAIVLFEAERSATLAQFDPALVRSLRRWDFIGRLDIDRPALAALLPETNRAGARGLIRRLGSKLNGIRTGIATYPEDGPNLAKLVEVATSRAIRTDFQSVPSMEAVDTFTWVRGIPAIRASQSITCPRCGTRYALRWPLTADELALDRARRAALAILQVDCPDHPERISAG